MERVHQDQRHEESVREPSGLRSPQQSPGSTVPASAEDASEVFELQPLSKRQATARVQKRGPARFRFVTDGD